LDIIAEEYYKSNSIVAKVYLYWILYEKEYHNLAAVYRNLMLYKNMKLSYWEGCDLWHDTVEILAGLWPDHVERYIR
jgi:hypothetical protein